MESQDKKKAFASAQKEVKEEDVKKLKEVIKATLKKLAEKEKDAKALAEEIKILRNDIKDFKEGRLDRIAERQKESAKAKDTSVFKIKEKVMEHHHHYDYSYPYWTQPYWIEVKQVPYYYPGQVYCGVAAIDKADVIGGVKGTAGYITDSVHLTANGSDDRISFTCSGSTAKAYSSGTYQLGNDTVKMI